MLISRKLNYRKSYPRHLPIWQIGIPSLLQSRNFILDIKVQITTAMWTYSTLFTSPMQNPCPCQTSSENIISLSFRFHFLCCLNIIFSNLSRIPFFSLVFQIWFLSPFFPGLWLSSQMFIQMVHMILETFSMQLNSLYPDLHFIHYLYCIPLLLLYPLLIHHLHPLLIHLLCHLFIFFCHPAMCQLTSHVWSTSWPIYQILCQPQISIKQTYLSLVWTCQIILTVLQ